MAAAMFQIEIRYLSACGDEEGGVLEKMTGGAGSKTEGVTCLVSWRRVKLFHNMELRADLGESCKG